MNDLERAEQIARAHAHEDRLCKRVAAQLDAVGYVSRWDVGGVMRRAYAKGWVARTDEVTHPSELELLAEKLLNEAGYDRNGQPTETASKTRARPVGQGWSVDAA